MTELDDIIARITSIRQELKALGVAQLDLFGSTARHEQRTNSDADFIVSFSGPATFDQFMDVKFMLEDMLQRPVDLTTDQALKPALRKAIEPDRIRVA